MPWVPFYEDHLDLFSGITLHRCQGHSPVGRPPLSRQEAELEQGLVVMQVNLPKDGTFIFTR
jgi:hypothetical protein